MALKVATWIIGALTTSILMEFWAALLHGQFWHGIMWKMHRSHHRPRHGQFEANDWLSLLHAPFAIALILFGCRAAPSFGREVAFSIGIGMTLFGLAYMLIHDGMVHQRLPLTWLRRFAYFRRVEECHEKHHTLQYKGVPYGFFLGALEIRLLAAKSTSERRVAGE